MIFSFFSRNQLSYLPASLCELPLQVLVLNNNRLVSLPEEIGKMQTLMELVNIIINSQLHSCYSTLTCKVLLN